MKITDLPLDEFMRVFRELNEMPLSDEHRRIAEDTVDALLLLGAVTDQVRTSTADALLATIAHPRERMAARWHVQQLTLRAAIAEGHGVPFALLQAEARQRQALRTMDLHGLGPAQEAEDERIRTARSSDWCIEFECRNRPTDCTDLGSCCWHCGRPNHRSNFSAAQAALEDE